MIPIYEQGRGKGIGLLAESFRDRFETICREHTQEGKAKAFAFIFYDFNDIELKKILKDQGVFAKLDRLSGNKLSIFYLHTAGEATVRAFNADFLAKLEISEKVKLPCVVFFRFVSNKFRDIAVAQLDSANLLHGFHELYGVIEYYIETGGFTSRLRYVRWLKSAAAFVSAEVFRTSLRIVLGHFL